MKLLIKLFILNRRTVTPEDLNSSLTVIYCRTALTFSFFYAAAVLTAGVFLLTLRVLLFPNNQKLPMNFSIVGLPFEGFSMYWAVNYFVQIPLVFSASVFFMVYTVLVMILLNHSCWLGDSTSVYIDYIDSALNRDNDPPSHPLQAESILRNLKTVEGKIADIVLWRKETFDLLEPIVLLGSSFCIWLSGFFSSSTDSFTAMFAILLWVAEVSMFFWMKLKETRRLRSLARAFYGINWEKIAPSRRKELLASLRTKEYVRSFHGVFITTIELEIFHKVSTGIIENSSVMRFEFIHRPSC